MKSTVKELKTEAKARGIKGYYRMRKAELLNVLSQPILDEPIPEINVPIIKPTKYVKLLKKVESSINKDINKFPDWILSVVPEPIVRNVNSRIDKLKEG